MSRIVSSLLSAKVAEHCSAFSSLLLAVARRSALAMTCIIVLLLAMTPQKPVSMFYIGSERLNPPHIFLLSPGLRIEIVSVIEVFAGRRRGTMSKMISPP